VRENITPRVSDPASPWGKRREFSQKVTSNEVLGRNRRALNAFVMFSDFAKKMGGALRVCRF